jgi:hypothetical protein
MLSEANITEPHIPKSELQLSAIIQDVLRINELEPV